MPQIPAIITKVKPDGRKEYSLNSKKLFYRPFTLRPDRDSTDGTLSLSATAGATDHSPMNVSQEGPVQIYSFVASSDRFDAYNDYGILVEIKDAGSGKSLMSSPVHMNTIFGTPEFPMVLPEMFYLNQRRSLTVTIENIFAYEQDVDIALQGRRIYPTSAHNAAVNKHVSDLAQRSIGSMPYFLTTSETLTLSAGTTNTYSFPSEADAYFEAFGIAAVAYDNDNSNPNMDGDFECKLYDGETERKLHTGKIKLSTNFGTGQRKYVFPESFLVQPNKNIRMEITNTTPNSHETTIYITFIGRKLYV